jgi:dTDP-4-dehydrorhamnose reductase
MNKILIAGINGQLGQELRHLLLRENVIGISRQEMDLTQLDRIRQVIQEIKPNFIINAAAYTAVDQAEKEPELAKLINAIAPGIIAEEAQKIGSILLHISTDYIFDGQKSTPYTEEDIPNPLGVYGKSKLLGEEKIKQTSANYIILRTAWVYSTYGKGNFVKTMLRLGREQEEIRVVADRLGTPTWTRDIAGAIASLISIPELIYKPATYHFTNSGVATWYDFAVAIFEEAQQLGFPLKVRRVIPITSLEYPTLAQRPAYCLLSCQKISTVLKTHFPHWRTSLRQMLKIL